MIKKLVYPFIVAGVFAFASLLVLSFLLTSFGPGLGTGWFPTFDNYFRYFIATIPLGLILTLLFFNKLAASEFSPSEKITVRKKLMQFGFLLLLGFNSEGLFVYLTGHTSLHQTVPIVGVRCDIRNRALLRDSIRYLSPMPVAMYVYYGCSETVDLINHSFFIVDEAVRTKLDSVSAKDYVDPLTYKKCEVDSDCKVVQKCDCMGWLILSTKQLDLIKSTMNCNPFEKKCSFRGPDLILKCEKQSCVVRGQKNL